MKNQLIFSLLLLLATTPLIAQDSLATVYFYRLGKDDGVYVGYDVKHNNQMIGRIKSHNMFTYHCPAGLQTFSASIESESSFKLNITAGETYYVECGMAAGELVGRPSFRLASPEKAKEEIANFQATPASVAVGSPSANGQDTLNFLYQRLNVPGKEGSHFSNPDHSLFISSLKKESDHRFIKISLDTSQYEIHWKGITKQLFRGAEFITNISYIIVPFGVRCEYTINGITYLLRKSDAGWTCYAGKEEILSMGFYKKDNFQIVQMIMLKETPHDDALKVATLYCTDLLIRTKKTTFGKTLRAVGLFQLIR